MFQKPIWQKSTTQRQRASAQVSETWEVDVFDLAASSQMDRHERPWGISSYDDPAEEAAFLAWYEELSAKPTFSEIKSNIIDIISNAPDWQLSHDLVLPPTFTCFWLVRELFESCWEATNFQQYGDPVRCNSERFADAKETRAVVVDLANKLSGRLQAIANDEHHPLRLNLLAASRLLEKSNKGIKIEWTDWAEVITTLAGTMRNVPLTYYRTHRACLEYPEPIKSGREVSVATALAFDLSFTFRWYTHDSSPFRRKGPMPKHGSPCWSVVAELVNLTLDLSITAEGARDTVRRLIENSAPYRSDWMRRFPRSS